MKREPGIRVGAISHTEGETIFLYGYGVFEGHHVPTAEDRPAGWMGDAIFEEKISNPRIRLDDGKVIWGCECWWGPEAEVQKRAAKFESCQKVDIEDRRKEDRASTKET